jgi:RNA polymerase sigma factor (sigma-70 family)
MSIALSSFIRRLRGSIGATPSGGLSDTQLLDRWLALRDEAAFEVLLWRYGPMILGVCRRMLRNAADVENAFQATFLLLVRKAAAIRHRESVAAWLYQVAYRVALRARQCSVRRNARETDGVEQLADDAPHDVLRRELRAVLDDEINHLPAKYRTPFVRCYLEGCTNEEAAVELNCPVGTIHSRLAWARQRLRSRLVRRGMTLTAVGLTALLAHGVAPAAVPPLLAGTTLQAAFAYATHSAKAAGVSAGAVALTKGVLRTMFLAKLKLGGAVVLALTLCGGAGGLAFYRVAGAACPPRGLPTAPAALVPDPQPAPAAPAQPAPVPRTIRVPAEVDGRLLGVFTEIKPDDKVAEKDVVVVGKQKYRRLREGDAVKAGQLLARVNDALALDNVDVAEAKTAAAEAEVLTTLKTKEEAKQRWDSMVEACKRFKDAFPNEEVRGAELTYNRYVQEEVAKKANVIVAQRQLSQARTQLKMYEIRSPVDGVIKTVHLRSGEAVKRLETVLEILPLDDDK